ncbi:hypothetical protein EON63_09865 [archaeon]|nr:MAG: hypothetical protein EON63_09865 [archaeon]
MLTPVRTHPYSKVPSILVTSCGYPDVAARAAVHYMYNFFPVCCMMFDAWCKGYGVGCWDVRCVCTL